MGYEAIDISGDAGIKAWGASLEEAFADAITGMYSLITDIGSIEERQRIEVSKEADSLETLLIALLNELVYRFDVDGFVGKRAEVEIRGERAVARVYGGEFDPEKNPGGLLVKAATYHGLKIENRDSMWEMEIIFDI